MTHLVEPDEFRLEVEKELLSDLRKIADNLIAKTDHGWTALVFFEQVLKAYENQYGGCALE